MEEVMAGLRQQLNFIEIPLSFSGGASVGRVGGWGRGVLRSTHDTAVTGTPALQYRLF